MLASNMGQETYFFTLFTIRQSKNARLEMCQDQIRPCKGIIQDAFVHVQ